MTRILGKHRNNTIKNTRRRGGKKTKKRKGGKFIDSGSYGCVYRPALLCKGETSRRANVVSKLMKRKEAKKELKENEYIDRIDPTFRFHLPTPEKCLPEEPDEETDNKFRDCDIAMELKEKKPREWFEKLAILQIPDGGTSLTNALDKMKDERTKKKIIFIMGIKNLFEGLKVMMDNKYVHYDIKSDNIVVRKKNNQTYRFNYIDFGLAINNLDEDEPFDSIFNSGYFVRPFELVLLDSSPIKKKLGKSKKYKDNEQEDVKKTLLKSPIKILFHNKPKEREILYDYMKFIYEDSYAIDFNDDNIEGSKSIYLPSKEEFLEDKPGKNSIFTEYMNEITNNNIVSGGKIHEENYNNYLRNVLKKNDVFSMGLIMIELWNMLSSSSKFNMDREDNDNKLENEFYHLIKNMTSFHHKNRYDAEEALHHFNRVYDLLLEQFIAVCLSN